MESQISGISNHVGPGVPGAELGACSAVSLGEWPKQPRRPVPRPLYKLGEWPSFRRGDSDSQVTRQTWRGGHVVWGPGQPESHVLSPAPGDVLAPDLRDIPCEPDAPCVSLELCAPLPTARRSLN